MPEQLTLIRGSTADPPVLPDYDHIVVATSGGKDSQAMTSHVCALAAEAGVLDRVVLVHADLGRVEWPGVTELVTEHAAHHRVRLEIERRTQGDLLEHVRKRGMWPSPAMRYCTSDHKRGPSARVLTRLARESRGRGVVTRPVRILSCLGMRAEESPGRRRLVDFELDERHTNGRREVWRWLPIHQRTVAEVWRQIKAEGTRHHPAYDFGMPRLSCPFCIFSPRDALLRAGELLPDLLAEYVAVEAEIDHKFQARQSLAEIQEALAAGERAGDVQDWRM